MSYNFLIKKNLYVFSVWILKTPKSLVDASPHFYNFCTKQRPHWVKPPQLQAMPIAFLAAWSLNQKYFKQYVPSP